MSWISAAHSIAPGQGSHSSHVACKSHLMKALPPAPGRCFQAPFRVGRKIHEHPNALKRTGLVWQCLATGSGRSSLTAPLLEEDDAVSRQVTVPRIGAEAQFRIPTWAHDSLISRIGRRLLINFPKISGYSGYVGIRGIRPNVLKTS